LGDVEIGGGIRGEVSGAVGIGGKFLGGVGIEGEVIRMEVLEGAGPVIRGVEGFEEVLGLLGRNGSG